MVSGGVKEVKERLKKAWQLPTLIVGTLMLLIGFWLTLQKVTPDPVDVGKTLELVRTQVIANNNDLAIQNLQIIEQQPNLTDDQLAQYHQLMARSVYQKQTRADEDQGYKHELPTAWRQKVENTQYGLDSTVRYQDVIKHFLRAQELNPEILVTDDREALVRSYAYLGQDDEALAMIRGFDPLKERQAKLRRELMRWIIRDNLERPSPDMTALNAILRQYFQQVGLSADDKVWATINQAEILLRENRPDSATKLLDLRWDRIQDASPLNRLELMVWRGVAKRRNGDLDTALTILTQVETDDDSKALPSSVLAMLYLNLGDIKFALEQNRDLNAARNNYLKVINLFPSQYPHVTEAKVGLASYYFRVPDEADEERQMRETWDLWESAIEDVKYRYPSARLKAFILDRLREEREWQVAGNKHPAHLQNALGMFDLEEDLAGDLNQAGLISKARVLEEIGRRLFDERMVEEIAGGRSSKEANIESAIAWSWLAAPMRRIIREYFVRSAQTWSRYADREPANSDTYDNALWHAGLNYGLANDANQEVELLSKFMQSNGEDERAPEGLYRLGLAHMDLGEREQAVQRFVQLSEQYPQNEYSERIYLPIADAYVRLGRYQEAETWLRKVRNTPAITPDSPIYQEALGMLGNLLFEQGGLSKYKEAIENLQVSLDRHALSVKQEMLKDIDDKLAKLPNDRRLQEERARIERQAPETLAVNYYAYNGGYDLPGIASRIGISNKRIAEDVLETLSEPGNTPSVRDELEAERQKLLNNALNAFTLARQALDERFIRLGNQGLASVQATLNKQRQDIYFDEANALYELQRWSEAADIYSAITTDWEEDPRSLIAYVQLINTHLERNDLQRARAENRRFREKLQSFSEELLMEQGVLPEEFWTNWDRIRSQLNDLQES